MSPEEGLKIRIQEREALLQQVVHLLKQDGRIVAAWLIGSLGRAEEDGLSDLDLWVVVADEYSRFVNAGRRDFVTHLAPPLLILEAPQNAPEHGAYLLTLYPGQAGPHQIDWYWQPLSEASLPENAHLLFDHAGIPSSGLQPLQTAPDPQTPTERAAAASERTNFFWAMIPIAAKKAARRQTWEALGMIGMIRGTLKEVKRLIGAEGDETSSLNLPPPVQPAEQMQFLRQMAREMEALTPPLLALGGTVPAEAVPQVQALFDLAESMLK